MPQLRFRLKFVCWHKCEELQPARPLAEPPRGAADYITAATTQTCRSIERTSLSRRWTSLARAAGTPRAKASRLHGGSGGGYEGATKERTTDSVGSRAEKVKKPHRHSGGEGEEAGTPNVPRYLAWRSQGNLPYIFEVCTYMPLLSQSWHAVPG